MRSCRLRVFSVSRNCALFEVVPYVEGRRKRAVGLGQEERIHLVLP